MVRQVLFHVEGEEERRRRGPDIQLRLAFQRFFRELVDIAQGRGISIRFRLHGTRGSAYEKFRDALSAEPDTYHVLLVDSEDPVALLGECWKHLERRAADRWPRPAAADEEQCQLMVQAVEAWLFADPEALASFYGQGFHRNSLPTTADVEEIPKRRHIPSLQAATKDTQKGRYHKIHHLALLLSLLDPKKVRKSAPHCERIFTTLGPRLRSLR
jgi:hypothetical protein